MGDYTQKIKDFFTNKTGSDEMQQGINKAAAQGGVPAFNVSQAGSSDKDNDGMDAINRRISQQRR